jgi:hypothetical protein
MCPQKRRKRDGKEGSFPGRRGSESKIKSSRKKKAAFVAVTCHAKHGFSGQTPKKKKNSSNASYQQCFFFYLRPISIHRVIFHPISVHRVVPTVVSFPSRSPARRKSAREEAREGQERESACGRVIQKRSGTFVGRQFPALAVISSLQFSL